MGHLSRVRCGCREAERLRREYRDDPFAQGSDKAHEQIARVKKDPSVYWGLLALLIAFGALYFVASWFRRV